VLPGAEAACCGWGFVGVITMLILVGVLASIAFVGGRIVGTLARAGLVAVSADIFVGANTGSDAGAGTLGRTGIGVLVGRSVAEILITVGTGTIVGFGAIAVAGKLVDVAMGAGAGVDTRSVVIGGCAGVGTGVAAWVSLVGAATGFSWHI